MKIKLLLVLMSMVHTLGAFAGALRVPDSGGETSDYIVTAALLKKGTVALEARKYQRDTDGKLQETERKYFKVSSDVLKASGIESGSLISLVLSKSIRGDVFCTVEKFSSIKSAEQLECNSLVVSASVEE